MSKINVRNKGANFERSIARILRLIYPNAKRGSQTFHHMDVKIKDEDIVNVPYHLELSCGNGESIWSKMRQAKRDLKYTGSDKVPIVVKKRDREQPVVMMSLRDFLLKFDKEILADDDLKQAVSRALFEEFGGKNGK